MERAELRKKRNSRSGFTLIEILLVVVIIGILAAVAVPRFAGRTKQAKIGAAKASIKAIGVALDMYEMDHGSYPGSLQALITNPGSGDDWKGPYLKDGLPNDPWGNPFIYTVAADSYDLKSSGPPDGGGEITSRGMSP